MNSRASNEQRSGPPLGVSQHRDQTPRIPSPLGSNNEKTGSNTSQDTLVSKNWKVSPTTRLKSSDHWWPWEWLCELLALGSLAAMILVLMQYQNKPQSDWRQSYFTLNGLIAFLATLMKTGIIIPVSAAIGQRKWLRFLPTKGGHRARRLGDFEVFDEASRGSLGSAKLVFSLNAWDIAYLGAFITIVSVFFGAITQNVVSTYDTIRDGRIVDLNAGRVPRSEAFNKTNQPEWTSINLQQHFRTDISTIAAVYSGIMSNSIPDVPISCATGNCTWPIVPTLGICGACMDMQRQLEVESCGGMGWPIEKQNCNYTIPGVMTLSKPRTLMEWHQTTPVFVAGPGSDFIFTQPDIVGKGHIYAGVSFDFIGQSYSEFTYANRGNYSPGNETAYYQANVLAYECGLWACLQARSINASDGVVQDLLIDHRNGAKPVRTDKGMFNAPLEFENDPSFNVRNISDYNLEDYSTLIATHNTLVGALSGSITINANWDVDYTWAKIPSEYTGGLNGGMGSAADCLHAAWQYADDFDRWWARIAKSLTNDIRTHGFLRAEEQGRYDGTAWTEIVHIQVRWLWLIFPGVLVALSILFLVATMIASWRRGVKPWKSFMLPVLYTRLEDGLQAEWKEEYAQDHSLVNEVKDRWVGLDSREEAWVFRHVAKDTQKRWGLNFAGDTTVDG